MTSHPPAHGVRDLKLKVATHLREIATEALDNDNIDLGLVARIADALWSLIDEIDERDREAYTAVRGAVDYFVLNRDEVSDLDDPAGFVDDARIVNQVAHRLGLGALAVRVPSRPGGPALPPTAGTALPAADAVPSDRAQSDPAPAGQDSLDPAFGDPAG